MNNLVKTQESNNGKYRINIYYDECADSPCTNWDLGGCYLFEYRDSSTLHSECNWADLFDTNRHSLESAVRKLVGKYVDTKDIIKYIKGGNIDKWRMRYDRSDRMWYLEKYCFENWYTHERFYPSDLKNFDYSYELTEWMDKDDLLIILDRYAKGIYVKEFSMSGYCQGDYIEGIAYCTKERYKKYVNNDTKGWLSKVEEILDGDIECVNRWMWGDVYGYVLEERKNFTKTYENGETEEDCEWIEIDSCWGFFEEPDEIIKENLPNEKGAHLSA